MSQNRYTVLRICCVGSCNVRAVQRATWTDDRLDGLSQRVDDLSQRMDAGFSRVDHRFEVMAHRFDNVDRRFSDVDRQFEQINRRFEHVDHRLDTVTGAIIDLHKTLNRIGAAIVASLAGVIVATLLSSGA